MDLFFHATFFTIKIIIIWTIAGICYRILWIMPIYCIKLFHQRYKTIHIWSIRYSMAYSSLVSNFTPSIHSTSLFIVSINSVILTNILSLFLMQDFFQTQVYLFAFASILVPSMYAWSRSTWSFSKMYALISANICSIIATISRVLYVLYFYI